MTRPIASLLFGVALLTGALSASAELKAAKPIAFATLAQGAECAFSLQVTDSVGGLTDGTEKLSLGASYSYTLGSAFSGKTLDAGKYVLYASPSFVSSSGATADVSIPDADCSAFTTSGGNITFDGSLNQNPGLFSWTIPANFGPSAALNEAGAQVDLTQGTVMLYGFTGSWTIGAAGPGGQGGQGGQGGDVPGGTGGSYGGAGGQTAAAGGDSDDESCSACVVGAPARGATRSGALLLGLVLLLLRRRR